jgi:hypothetical protein
MMTINGGRAMGASVVRSRNAFKRNLARFVTVFLAAPASSSSPRIRRAKLTAEEVS